MPLFKVIKPKEVIEYRTKTFIDEVKDAEIIELRINKRIDNKVELIYDNLINKELNHILFQLGSKKGCYLLNKDGNSLQIQNIVSNEDLSEIEIYISGSPLTPFKLIKQIIKTP